MWQGGEIRGVWQRGKYGGEIWQRGREMRSGVLHRGLCKYLHNGQIGGPFRVAQEQSSSNVRDDIHHNEDGAINSRLGRTPCSTKEAMESKLVAE